MFVNMRHPHVIQTIRKDSGVARPTSGRGSVGGGVLVLRYGKSLRGSAVMNVFSEIDYSNIKTETGNWSPIH